MTSLLVSLSTDMNLGFWYEIHVWNTTSRLARSIGVPARRIQEIVRGSRAITADTALRLARYFSTSTEFWLNLQSHYDLEMALEQLGDRLEREVKPLAMRHTVTETTLSP